MLLFFYTAVKDKYCYFLSKQQIFQHISYQFFTKWFKKWYF